ncbi:amino acid ABC transporter permease [Jeongeupia wiesaeckerbachi]|uniref:amino acid ABC transporter permease n=1 Tax=Jeongeupia wiesaeckerbachi TaxID=3051218 RepID=UPI003D806171
MEYGAFTSYDLVLLAEGLGVSVLLFLATFAIGLVLALVLATIRFYRVPLVVPVITMITELLKNSPVLVQLFLVFFGLPMFAQINVTPVAAATITLSLNTAAFIYVIAVAAIDATGREQIETARVFGLSNWQILRKIVATPASAFAIGPLVGLAVNQLQVTSLVSAIGVIDLTKVGNILNLRTLEPFIVWTVVGILYFLCSKAIARLGGRLETRLRAHSAWKGL